MNITIPAKTVAAIDLMDEALGGLSTAYTALGNPLELDGVTMNRVREAFIDSIGKLELVRDALNEQHGEAGK